MLLFGKPKTKPTPEQTAEPSGLLLAAVEALRVVKSKTFEGDRAVVETAIETITLELDGHNVRGTARSKFSDLTRVGRYSAAVGWCWSSPVR